MIGGTLNSNVRWRLKRIYTTFSTKLEDIPYPQAMVQGVAVVMVWRTCLISPTR